MNKLGIIILVIGLGLVSSACASEKVQDHSSTTAAHNLNASQPAENAEVKTLPETNGELMLLNENTDWNKDGNSETLKVSVVTDNTMKIFVEYDGLKQEVSIRGNGSPISCEIVQLDESTPGLEVKISGAGTSDAGLNPMEHKLMVFIWAFKDNKLMPVFNTTDHAANQPNNYEIKYEGERKFTLTDKMTAFSVVTDAVVDEGEEPIFNRIVENTEVMKKQFATSLLWFAEADFINDDEGGAKINLVKLIPGYSRVHSLGYFRYTYNWNGDEFVLRQEGFFTAKGVMMLEPKLLKETNF
ncbi:hypothetical protein PAECIP111893_05199 [Paenibacillus plantiphilus]|uniref:Lipoprotein n=1 Tax=Paenibacillus plantiphilus TaxID=2905650 RepID=A0ABM9CX66_9BACL|nr:hypothetical protein [Paenibacillus plantiphilus]CAH1224954.1 hypothetical protein PAECIP111893_05199 [Paenibacillus plantiphilus]